MPSPQPSFYNRSLERALQILGSFTFEKRELTLVELSSALKLSKSTVYRLASTLTDYGFLRYDERSKKYSLGLQLFELGSIVFASFSLRKTASPHLDELHSRLGRTIFLGISQEDEVVYIDKRESVLDPIRLASEVGRRRPPYFGMFGQLLMAFLPDKEVDRILKKNPLKPITRKSITETNKFKERLRLIREQGFCVDTEEAIDGITGIAAPVKDYTGKVVAALGVGFITSSEDPNRVMEIIRAVSETAKNISRDLGNWENSDTGVKNKDSNPSRNESTTTITVFSEVRR
jgi:IclR family KDG regulon transcriptional repressor